MTTKFYQVCFEYEDEAQPFGRRFAENELPQAQAHARNTAAHEAAWNPEPDKPVDHVSLNLYTDDDGLATYVGPVWTSKNSLDEFKID